MEDNNITRLSTVRVSGTLVNLEAIDYIEQLDNSGFTIYFRGGKNITIPPTDMAVLSKYITVMNAPTKARVVPL